MISLHTKERLALIAALAAVLYAALPNSGHAAGVPSGEVAFAHERVEPAYNDRDGSFAFLLTPEGAQLGKGAPTAPVYIVLYPTEVAATIGPVICQHQPADNCPDHGPTLAGLAEAMMPNVYGNGVWGHDHLLAVPGGNGGFAINWLPIAVLFTTPEAASTHITTLDQLNDARAHGVVTEVPLPPATFHGAIVPAQVYPRGTPVVPAPQIQ
jgi:hypothetical protein